jgi:hypothetical protein
VKSDLAIVVAGYSRAAAINRLLQSLSQSSIQDKAKLYISIDGGGSEEVKNIAKEYAWPFGEKELIFHGQNLGLRQHILTCGDLTAKHDGIVLLEDDLLVANSFYRYALQSFDHFRDKEDVEGISLYSHPYNETSQFPFIPIEDGSDNFFFQYAPSWGQVWFRGRWQEFRQWYEENKDIKIGEGIVMPRNILLWPDTSWKKYYIHYLIVKNRYFAYPRKSLTTIFSDEGTNIRIRETFLQAPLWHEKNNFDFSTYPESVAVYDCFGEILPDRLKRKAAQLKEFDFEVDLYGMKPLERSAKKYILSGRKPKSSLISFGREMKPHEENVIHSIPGDDFHLAKVEDFSNVPYMRKLLKVHYKKLLAYWYPIREYHFSGKGLITTNKDPEKNIDPPFISKKIVAVGKYARKYFFGKK